MNHPQFREVIQWEDPNSNYLFEKFDHIDGEIKNASKLIIHPGQGCVITLEGKIEAVHTEPGMYDLRSGNVPFLTTLKKLVTLRQESESKVGIWFFRTGDIMNLRWGTKVPISYSDPVYTFPILLSAFGNFSVKIVAPKQFFEKVIAGEECYTTSELKTLFLSRIIQPITNYLANAKFSYVDIDSNLNLIAAESLSKTKVLFEDLGFEIIDFRMEGTQFDKTTLERIDGISDVQANMVAAKLTGIDYAEMERIKAMRDAAKNEGAAGAAVSMFAGVSLGQSINNPSETKASSLEKSPLEKLKELKQMRELELITESEYNEKKTEIISAM